MKSDDQNLSIFLFQFLEKIISLSFFFCIVIISCLAACLIHYCYRPAFKSFLRLLEVYSRGNEEEKIQLLLRNCTQLSQDKVYGGITWPLHKFNKEARFCWESPLEIVTRMLMMIVAVSSRDSCILLLLSHYVSSLRINIDFTKSPNQNTKDETKLIEIT